MLAKCHFPVLLIFNQEDQMVTKCHFPILLVILGS
jgi:hypothetical protein